MKHDTAAHACHLLVCTNDRHGDRKSCADGGSPAVRAALKQAVKDRGWPGRVRVSQTGCLGLCAKGPNILIYPHDVWISGVTEDDVDAVVDRVAALLDDGQTFRNGPPS